MKKKKIKNLYNKSWMLFMLTQSPMFLMNHMNILKKMTNIQLIHFVNQMILIYLNLCQIFTTDYEEQKLPKKP